MATQPMPNPQASAPPPGAGASAQANPLSDILGKLAMATKQLGSQNTVIQEEMSTATNAFVQAIQKVEQSASGAPQQPAAPMQQ